ncbi:putative Homocysteine S-methyltransferase [Seiridium unicorne]|uniref:Homocysteine S-methyltransferase n=1 Tax=Seiridium unicorne TaxID=138068 RepID=A0ABR2UH50_9PEZI
MKKLAAILALTGTSLASQYTRRQILPIPATLSEIPTGASLAPLSISTVSGPIPVSTASSAKCGKGYTYCGFMLQSGGHNFAPEIINKTYCDALEGNCVDGMPKTKTDQAVFLCMNDSPASIQLFCACGGKCLDEAATNNIAHYLPKMGSIQILDGGLGTSLEDSYGVTFDHSKPLWSTHFLIEGQDTLFACQRDFAEAGADVILTATYQTSVEGFGRTRIPDYPDGIPQSAIGSYLQKAVEIAEKVTTSTSAKVALSLGPYGACMIPGQEYSGNYDDAHSSEETLYSWHLERLRLFTNVKGLAEKVQYVALETIPRVDELRAVRRAVQDSGITAPFWISGVFPGDGNQLPDGSSIDAVVEAMIDPAVEGAKPWGVGINCTKIHKLTRIIEAFETSVASLIASGRLESAPALVLYPDGTKGEIYNTTTKKWEKPEGHAQETDTQESWAAQLAGIVKASRERGCFRDYLVGGCCKASAEDIGELSRELRDSKHG